MRRHLWPVLRLGCFVLACCAVLIYVDYRAARASVVERLMGIGQRMAAYLDDGRATEAPRRIRINGVHLYVAAGRTADSPASVQRWYAERYGADHQGMDAFRDALVKAGALPGQLGNLNQFQFGDAERGGMAAIDYGGPVSRAELLERVRRFGKTGDLGALGRLRYVYHEKTSGGGTRFLTAWTDDSFVLDKLVPAGDGDAAGADVEGIPRYPGSVRRFSSEEEGLPQRLAMYEAPGSPEGASLFYRARLPTLGWRVDERFATVARDAQSNALHVQNAAGREALIDVSPAKGGGVMISVVQLR